MTTTPNERAEAMADRRLAAFEAMSPALARDLSGDYERAKAWAASAGISLLDLEAIITAVLDVPAEVGTHVPLVGDDDPIPTTAEMRDALMQAIEAWADEAGLPLSTASYADVGMMTMNDGLVITVADREYQVQIVRSR